MLKLTRKLLQGIASALVRYASSIEKLLAQDNSTVGRSLNDYSDERPPAHWLAKVRQGTPHLLENRFNDTQSVSYSSGATSESGLASPLSDATNEEPPAHWMEKVRRGAPYLLNGQPVAKKRIPEQSVTLDRESLLQPNHQTASESVSIQAGSILKPTHTSETRYESYLESSLIKKSGPVLENTRTDPYDSFRMNSHKTEIQLDESRQKISTDLPLKQSHRKVAKPFTDNAILTSSEKKTVPFEAEIRQPYLTRPLAKNSEIKSKVPSGKPRLRMQQLNITIPNAATHDENYQQQTRTRHKQFSLDSRTRIERDRREKSSVTQRFSDHIAESDSVNKSALNQRDFNETVAAHSKKTTHFIFSHKLEEQPNHNRQRIDRHLPKTGGTVITDIPFGSNQQQYIIPIANTVEPFESDIPRWPSLPGEREKRLSDDPWPELPEENLSVSDKMFQSAMNFAQLQNTLARNRRSELEQRGKSWNG